MTWILIILIWVVAPFAELGIIIGLAVTNDKYKRRIQELEHGMLSRRAAMGSHEFNAGRPVETEVQMSEDRNGTEARNMKEEWHRAGSQDPEELPPQGSSQYSDSREAKQIISSRSRSGLGTFALILGVIFIVLAGLIFATTTWRVLPDICKVCSVLVCSGLFFGVSHLAERRFHVHKTGNAFYILGSIFLFLSILAAAYFKLLGAEFILDGINRWKVLWVGSVVTIAAFWAGLKRFHDKIYTQSCLWGISINLFFMAKAFAFGWDGFAAVMMVYSAILVMGREYLESRSVETVKEHGFLSLLLDGFGSFAPIHFWVFGVIAIIRGLAAIWIMIAECAVGYADPFLDKFSLFSFTAFGMTAMTALVIGSGVMARRRKTENYIYLFYLAALEAIMYGAGWITDDLIYRMAIVNEALLVIQILRYRNRKNDAMDPNVFWDICGGGVLLFSIIIMTVLHNDKWRFVYLLMAALYCVLYRKIEAVRKQALSLSACFAAAAFWLQPFGMWPEVIRLEMSLVPVAWLLWTAGLIWDKTSWISPVQNLGFVMCLALLFLDAVFSGLVVDSLLLEGVCLAAFVRAQVKNSIWWVRISGGMSLVVALFMTRGFWLSISWWAYLLGAGIGLVVFAGIMEKKE